MTLPRIAALIACTALLSVAAFAQPSAEKADLMNFAKGQLPTDTGSDKKFYSLVDHPDLGKALKVEFPPSDSFGDRAAKVTDWKRYAAVEFDAFNPEKESIKFGFNVPHRRTTSFQTRVEVPFTLKPGKNQVRLGIDEMSNINGSAPDLAHVTRWYIASQSDKPVTVYFGNITLEGGEAAPAAAPAAAAAAPNVGLPHSGDHRRPQGRSAHHADSAEGVRRRRRRRSAATRPAWSASRPPRCRRSTSRSCSTRPRPTPSSRPWRCSRRTIRGTWSSTTGRCIPTRRTSSPPSAPTSRFRYNPDMGFVLVPPDQKKMDVKTSPTPASRTRGRSRCRTTCRSKAGRTGYEAARS